MKTRQSNKNSTSWNWSRNTTVSSERKRKHLWLTSTTRTRLTLASVFAEILKKYLKKQENARNIKQEHIDQVGFYSTKKELDREMGKHRREVLSRVAYLYQQEKEEFYQKYRVFQLHKWEILKFVKQKMLADKIKQV